MDFKFKAFQWNPMYQYLMNCWKKMDHTKSFKEQFTDKNVYITEWINEHNDHLILVRYNTYQCDFSDEKYMEARSLVIDLDKRDIVLCPFRKFFNINERPETSLFIVQELIKKADLVEITDKIDGSMQHARWYNDHIVLAGSTALDPRKSFQLKEGYDLFTEEYVNLCKDHPNYTFIFEAVLEDDEHVVNYSGNVLYLIGARNIFTGKTLTAKFLKDLSITYNIPFTLIENVTLEHCLNDKKLYAASAKEGWVFFIKVKNREYRFKLKCDNYVQMHLLLNQTTDDILVKFVAEGKTDDLLSKMSIAYKDFYQQKINKINNFVVQKTEKINSLYDAIPKDLINKDFALFVQNNIEKDYQPYMYQLKKGKSIDVLKKNTNSYVSWDVVDKFFQN